MYTKKITEDYWVGAVSRDVEKECISEQQVHDSIKHLDGDKRTIVVFERDSETNLTVGGGNDGRYVLYVQDKGKLHTLLNPTPQESGVVIIVAGGQEGKYDPTICISLESALRAALDFATIGLLTPSFTWKSD